MSTLFWSFLFIGLTVYVFAILFMSACTERFVAVGPKADDEISNILRERYGGIYSSMVTLFMVMTGGLDWKDAMTPLVTVWPVYEQAFIFFVFLMNFGVLNVVVGTFVATATEIASKDRQAFVKSEIRQLELAMHRIKTFFHEADTDKSGTLSWMEFRAHLQHPHVRAYFHGMGLDVSQAHLLFELLDGDENDATTIEEFLDGCLRLKGGARSLDMNMMLLMMRRMNDKFHPFVRRSNSFQDNLSKSMDRLCPPSDSGHAAK
mmetsp:Transcript_140331/g.448503  ORF Transcript_140331/g.448503 Transcript_140331/m.448503 type:complete len:262 (+) Transcript_140331:1100-1885(+)